MGITYLCDKPKGVIFTVWDGVVTLDDWLSHVHMVLADPDWLQIRRAIVDMQSVSDTSSVGDEQIDQAAAVVGAMGADLATKRIAVIAADEFRRTSRFESLVKRFGVTMVVFNSLDTACIFLGLDVKDTRQTLEQLRLGLRAQDGG